MKSLRIFLALGVLDYCYRRDGDQMQQLLLRELQNWSGKKCLSLAVAASHRALLAHPCSEIILADLEKTIDRKVIVFGR